MNLQNLISEFSSNNPANDSTTDQAPSQQTSPLSTLRSMIPSSLAGGAAAGGVMALLMGSKSTRKMARKVAAYGGTAVLGGLAYKAYGNWQQNKALGQTQGITEQDIQYADASQKPGIEADTPLQLVLIKAMIAAAQADHYFDMHEQKRLFNAIEKLNLANDDKAQVFDLMSRNISIQEIADEVSLDEHKAEVYLSAYLAIEVDQQLERTFLNNLAIALDLPKGFPAYLEQQADQGLAA